MRLARVSTIGATALAVLLAVALLFSSPAPAGARPSTGHTTYTVLVGAENAHRGIDVMSYFPARVTIHVGDTVRWVQNSNEIHTVTFLGGQALPDFVVTATSLGLPSTPGPMVLNPLAVDQVLPPGGLSSKATFANSGLMGRETGQVRSFTLTFAAAGTYPYLCIVHGKMMSGTVRVVSGTRHLASPAAVKAIGRVQIAREMAKSHAVIRAAQKKIKPAAKNADGSRTHYVMLGYHRGQIDLMRFFPSTLRVRPGDTVVWEQTKWSDAPHTVTFLNGTAEPPLVNAVPQAGGPPILYLNPVVLSPSVPSPTLTRTGLFNSGFMLPIPGTTFSLKIGDMTAGALNYLCLLHDTSGMKARLVVQSK